MTIDVQHLNDVLRPAAPPRVVEDLYTQDQYERMLAVIKRYGPWPTITAHHFDSVEELFATSNGGAVEGLNLTLDDVASAHFRGFFAESSVAYHPELHDCFYNNRFLQLAREYWGAQYARPTMMLFNLCGPHQSGLTSHLDAVTFRGVRFENSPIWLQNVMGRSGLFTDHLVKMAQVITWWYLGENGTFTYWPDGPLGEPKRLEHPLWNKGVVVQNESMFHRGDPVGRPDERDITGLKHRSLLGYDADRDDWAITTDGEVIRRYQPNEMRLLVHWNAEVYTDLDEVKKSMDHSDDLTHDIVFERLLADMHARGMNVAEPSDPLHDKEFIRALIAAYSISPTTDWATQPA
ncbi:hypothetical protein [Streptodolium elevatio]|uniref:Uncharacterized protein n=1 Tax=Streptodolium elevatio TaxID=3157996 RepID=A0ABV3DW09_9ACTN